MVTPPSPRSPIGDRLGDRASSSIHGSSGNRRVKRSNSSMPRKKVTFCDRISFAPAPSSSSVKASPPLPSSPVRVRPRLAPAPLCSILGDLAPLAEDNLQPSDASGVSHASIIGDPILLNVEAQLPLQQAMEAQEVQVEALGDQMQYPPFLSDTQYLAHSAPSASDIPPSNDLSALDRSETQIKYPQSGSSKAIIVYQRKRQKPNNSPDALKIVPASSLSVMPSSSGGLRRSARLRKKLQRSINTERAAKNSQLPSCPSLQNFIDLTRSDSACPVLCIKQIQFTASQICGINPALVNSNALLHSEDSEAGHNAGPEPGDAAPDAPVALSAPGDLAASSDVA
ncbi:hypothetical protein GUJ93_ZPchr0009g2455 [Zizania palustris]|uniref:Uncharacterized protein n=1 Tax=Zizania palustris TaxID=103762 RepID=A0A8J5RH05_ZIZPA|nr:hypothetical protein GUJ93_ZPchr0009g2455 [Zizania palustris]